MTSFSGPFSFSSTAQSYYDLHSQISEYWVIWFWTTSDFRKAAFVQLKSFNQLLTRDPTQKGRWRQFIKADSFDGLRCYHVNLLQWHLIYVMRDRYPTHPSFDTS